MSTAKLSVVIITHNEEKNIERCLDSVQTIADDIVVVDSFSTDATEKICKKFNANFIQRKWEGYSKTKNFANTMAQHSWILSLDADEALSEELKRSILKIKEQNELITGEFNRLTNYCGTWIKHCGWYPDKKIRIFDRTTSQWEGSIHEKLIINSAKPVIHLKGDCLHYSYYTLDDHYKQVAHFTDLLAKDQYEKGKKVSLIKLYMSPVVKFIRDYIIKLGILDGYAGLKISTISAYATYLKYYKTRKLYK